MPTYEYECESCGHSFEQYQSMTDKKLKTCPKCKKSKLHRLIGTGGGIIFKGTGFYETDFKTKKEQPCGPSCGCSSEKKAEPVVKKKAAESQSGTGKTKGRDSD